MNLKNGFSKRVAVSTLVLCLSLVSPLLAFDKYLPANTPDSIALLPPPPTPGSEDYKADLECARAVFKSRTPEQEKRAMKDATLTIFNFSPAIGEYFNSNSLPKTAAFFADLKMQAREPILTVKDHWKRTRPYDVDKSLWLGKPEASYSYPSGHSTIGTVQALVLAELFPDKKDAILQIGRNIGWDRVLIGKHFPTDVHAGRVLAQVTVNEFKKSPTFQKALEEVRAEIQSVRSLAANQKVAVPAK